MLWQERLVNWGLANPVKYTAFMVVITVIGVVLIVGRYYGIRLFKDQDGD